MKWHRRREEQVVSMNFVLVSVFDVIDWRQNGKIMKKLKTFNIRVSKATTVDVLKIKKLNKIKAQKNIQNKNKIE